MTLTVKTQSDLKKYAVSLVWTKNESDGSITTRNSLRLVTAINENEAFGLTYDDCGDVNKTYVLLTRVIVEIE